MHSMIDPENPNERIFVMDEYIRHTEAAKLFLEQHKGRLVHYNGSTFWRRDDSVFTNDPHEVKSGILRCITKMKIFIRKGRGDKLVPYSTDWSHANMCFRFVMMDGGAKDFDLTGKNVMGSTDYLAYDDGVYCFKTKACMPHPVENVYFTRKTNRRFPMERPSDDTVAEFMEKVLDPVFLGDTGARDYFLHMLSRALAGRKEKQWHACIGGGGRDDLLLGLVCRAFGDFVQVLDMQHLGYKRRCIGYKSIKWMESLQFARVAVFTDDYDDTPKTNSYMVRKIISDVSQQIHRKGPPIDLQASMFVFSDKLPLAGSDFEYRYIRAVNVAVKDMESVKEFASQDRFVDCFTWLVLDAFADGARMSVPASVCSSTNALVTLAGSGAVNGSRKRKRV